MNDFDYEEVLDNEIDNLLDQICDGVEVDDSLFEE